MDRRATAVWKGNIQNGKGELTTESGALRNTPYTFNTRFGSELGTNPEELIGAAHAGCFTMALSGALMKKGFTADRLETSAVVTVQKEGEGFTITSSKLKLIAEVPDIDSKTFQTIAEEAKAGCPVSKLLKANITLDVEFRSSQRGASATT
ncbi:OsmC family protein [Bdellovibrio bacteriovorus]|uniref:OsmC family protein n=1 Tax=Bdellovibrio TaxID=958 RepID=UPI0035A6C9E6